MGLEGIVSKRLTATLSIRLALRGSAAFAGSANTEPL
jgi:hypothetical protein